MVPGNLRCCRRQGSREGLAALVALEALGGQVDPVREQKALVSHVHSQAINTGRGGRCGQQHFLKSQWSSLSHYPSVVEEGETEPEPEVGCT